ncbi:MAG: GWxTD domain-containing protein [Saprospiraceae bacterium]|nr:GWxTD domain-containing protein [Saprospiraceae bacterium]
MKQRILILCFGLLSVSMLDAMDASVTYGRFKGPDQNYIEVYLNIIGETVGWELLDSTHAQATVDIAVIFRKNGEIIKFDRVQLHSPKATHPIDFQDLKRYLLPDGNYEMEVIIEDKINEENHFSERFPVEMNFSGPALLQSDIQLLQAFGQTTESTPFTKNGYFLLPLPFNFYGKYADKLMYYHEIYNADRVIGEDFVVSYSIERINGQGQSETVLIGHKRRSPEAVNVLLLQMDIKELASGNYRLVIEVRNRVQELLSRQSVDFTRANPFLNANPEEISSTGLEDEFVMNLSAEELEYSIRALTPKVDDTDGILLNELVKNKDLDAQRLYLFSYYVRINPNKPELAYEEYMQVARAVDQTFYSGLGHGFESDRGYTYLKYGAPDDIVSEMNDPVAPPYEVWSYYHFPATAQNNVKFIFYNASLASGDYRLLHSTATGEVSNPNWQDVLYQDANQNPFGESQGAGGSDGFGRRTRSNISDW